MKKLLLVALAAVGLASCVQTEELAVANNNTAIAFDTFVDNVTKTIYNNDNLDHFNVYGTITSDNNTVKTNIFPGVEVEKGANGWAYDSQYTQYWIPGFTYNFTAVVDGDVDVDATYGMPVTITTDMANQEDILYATVSRHFGANDTAAKVSFQFAHLLSKAKFTVKNSIAAGSGFVYNIESVTITNADASAVYNVADGVWAANGTYPADFGVAAALAQGANTVSKDVLLVPGTKELTIEVAYKLTYKGTELKAETKNLTAALTLEQGKAYNFIVEFGAPGEDIKFDAQVKDWVEGSNGGNGGNVTPGTSYVATAEEFTTAFAAEGIDRIVLADDIVLTTGATRAAGPSFVLNNGKELTINLGGKTLTANFTPADESAAVFDVRGTLNVENGTVIMNREDAAFKDSYRTCVFCTSFNGVVNLNGVTAKNNGGAGMAYVLDMSNATNAAYNVDNSILESTYIAVRIFNNEENGVHNATIKNSTLKGKYCFWVQYYLADGRSQEVLDHQLKLDIYNNNNIFVPAEGKLPILFGYNSFVSANGDGITKSVSEDGTVVTLGTLVENGVVGRGVAGAEKNSTITSVILKDGIAELPNRTFYQYSALETVELPNTLTILGAAGDASTSGNVFQGCVALKNIVIPESVTTMGPGLFYGCTALETVNIPSGVTRIEMNTFRETAIKNIEFHEGVTYIGKWAFRDCEVLEQIVINAPSFTVEADTFTNMAQPYPNFTIYVANAEMKTYLEGMLDAEEKKYITVVAPSEVTTTEQLTEALNNGETRVHLAAGTYTMPASSNFTAETVITCEEGVVLTDSDSDPIGLLNINGATIVGATFKGSNDNGVNLAKGTVNGTFKNCTFEGWSTLRYCYAGSDVLEFEGCTFKGYEYAVHFDSGTNKTLKFKNCKFHGTFTNGVGFTVIVEGCEFYKDLRGSFNIPNFYDKCALTNCNFVFDGTAIKEVIRLHYANEDATKHIFNSCTVNGSPLKDNLNYFTAEGKIKEGNKITIDNKVYVYTGGALTLE